MTAEPVQTSSGARDREWAGTSRGAPLWPWAWLAPWVALLVLPLTIRGPLPPDELRYLSVAWEMWSSGNWLVPQLNGMPYSDKGPVLFWLMHAGWALFGVNDWWPRSLPAIFALTAILLTRRLCRALWPENTVAIGLVPWLLLGTLGWTMYTQILLFDLLLVNWTLLALLALIRAERGDNEAWYIVAGVTGLGLLTKGPVMLLHLAGPALLVPWWAAAERAALPGWYGRLGLALLGGCLLALAWAVPAALLGGEAYASEILFFQTTGRFVESFAHARPFWFYLWMLPVLLLPWSAWPTAWRAGRAALGSLLGDRGCRLLLAGVVPALVVFMLISGKQPHYLLPMLPLLACLLAAALSTRAPAASRVAALAPALVLAAVALAFAWLPQLASGRDLSVDAWSPGWGTGAAVVILALGIAGRLRAVVERLALSMPILVIASEVAFFRADWPAYDLAGAASFARDLEESGHALAYVGDYNGELHFLGRLTEPFEILTGRDADTAEWARAHPAGYVIAKRREEPEAAAYSQRLRGQWLSIESTAEWIAESRNR